MSNASSYSEVTDRLHSEKPMSEERAYWHLASVRSRAKGVIGRFAGFLVAANFFFKHSRLTKRAHPKPVGVVVRICVRCAVVAVAVGGSLGEAASAAILQSAPQPDYYVQLPANRFICRHSVKRPVCLALTYPVSRCADCLSPTLPLPQPSAAMRLESITLRGVPSGLVASNTILPR